MRELLSFFSFFFFELRRFPVKRSYITNGYQNLTFLFPPLRCHPETVP